VDELTKSWGSLDEKQKKNLIFSAIVEGGFQPTDFRVEWEPRLRLTHPRTKDYFDFGSWDRDFSTFSFTRPGHGGEVQRGDITAPHDFRCIQLRMWEGDLRKWLQALDEDTNTPDLWAAIENQVGFANAIKSPTLDNRTFSSGEQQYVLAQLDGVVPNFETTS
jgi:hypothetical protein